jgi:hypothetical protein
MDRLPAAATVILGVLVLPVLLPSGVSNTTLGGGG